MIFYFSGTGNSEWAASKVAERLNERTFDIAQKGDIPDVGGEKLIGFVFPVYAWGAPEPMIGFAKKLKKTDAFTFGICTCGEEAGETMKKFSRIYPLDSAYSIVMPNNYLLGSDLEEREVVLRKIKDAERELAEISEEIGCMKKTYRVTEGKFAKLKSGIVNKSFNKFARSATPFHAEAEKCNGCGLCAAKCPSSAIQMSDGRPVWKGNCYQCLRCINSCPQTAIQYGKKTEGRRRYVIAKYL